MSHKTIIAFKPAFPHAGGKTRLLQHILPHIPEHNTYVEPFCGGCAVLLAKSRSTLEVINDADTELVCFLRYAQHHREILLAELARWPGNSRVNFAALLHNQGYTDLQRAVRWFLLKVSSFASKNESYGRSKLDYHGYDPKRHPALITSLSERLQRVTIECADWQQVADFYDTPETFFFFDPPYVECAKTSYRPFSASEMQRLRDWLGTAKGHWLLTCDDSPSCREIFAGLPAVPMSIHYSIGNKNAAPKQSGELLIFHPAIAPTTAHAIHAAHTIPFVRRRIQNAV